MAKKPFVAILLTLPAFQEVDMDEPALTEKEEKQEKQRKRKTLALIKDFLLQLPHFQKLEE